MNDADVNRDADEREAPGESKFARPTRELRLAVTGMKPGTPLGPAHTLGPAYGVSRSTMQGVLAALAAERNPIVVGYGKGQGSSGWRRAGGPRARSVAQRVVDGVRVDLVPLAPGDRLGTLQEMAARYGVGTQAVQEGMRRLKAEGLVTTRGSGPTGGWLKASPRTDGETEKASQDQSAGPASSKEAF